MIDDLGHVLTNYHVIQDAASVVVRDWQMNDHTTEVVGFDEESDLAVLRTPQPFRPGWKVPLTALMSATLFWRWVILTGGSDGNAWHRQWRRSQQPG